MRLGLTPTGWIAFRKQEMFTVHFLKKGEGRALCSQRTPYRQNFDVLPKNAVICERCRPSATAAYPRGQKGEAASGSKRLSAA